MKRKRQKILAMALSVAMLLSLILPTQVFASQGDVREANLYLIDNAWTVGNSPDSVGDSSSVLKLSGINPPSGYAKAAATRRNSYLKVDLAAIDYEKITSAELFWYTSAWGNGGLRTTSVYAVEGDWSGDTLTWNNAPDYDLAAENYSSATPLGQLDQNSNDGKNVWGSIDLTDYFSTLEPGLSEVSLVMTVNAGSADFSSMSVTNGTAPYVKVTYIEGSGTSDIPRNDITIKTVDNYGDTVLPDEIVTGQVTGRTYKYDGEIEPILHIDGIYYQYDADNSVLETEVKEGAEIIISYNKIEADEDGFVTLSIPAYQSGNTKESDPDAVQTDYPEKVSISSTGGGGNGAATNRNGFIKFDLSKYNVDVISSAEVHVYMLLAANNTSRDITIYRTSNDWDSSTLTWNNQPDATSDELGIFSCYNGTTGWIDYDVFSNLSSITAEDKEVSFRIECSAAAVDLASINDTNGRAPVLELTFKTFAEGEERTTKPINLRRIDENGNDIVDPEVIDNVEVSRTYFYNETVDEIMEVDGTYYLYEPDDSTLSVRVSALKDNEIILVYTTLADGTISSLTVSTVTSDGKTITEPYTVKNLWVGQEYFMNTVPEWVIDVDGVKYGYSDSFSSRKIFVQRDPEENQVTLLYKPLPTDEPTGELKEAQAPVIEAGWAMESTPKSNQVTDSSFSVSRSSKREWSDSTAKAAMQNRIGLMKFDLSDIAYDRIKSAKIHFTLVSSSNSGTRVIYAYPVSSAWETNTVTWNTAPLIPGERPDSAAGSIELDQLTSETEQEIDVSEFMQNLVGGETTLSFLFEVDTASVEFSSTGAYLDIEYYEGEPTEALTGNIVVRKTDVEGNDIADPETVGTVIEGRTYNYPGPDTLSIVADDGTIYYYNADESVTSVKVVGGTDNYIYLVYDILPIYPGEPTEVSLIASDNAYVVENEASITHDVSSVVMITGTEGGNGAATKRDALVKFDTSFIDAAQIDDATLSLVVTLTSNAGDRSLTIFPTDSSDWDSDTATWDNAPGYNESDGIDTVTIAQGATGYYTFDLSEYLTNLVEIPDVLSFRIVANTAVVHASSIAAGVENAMKLNISYTPAGEVTEKEYRDITIRYEDTEGELIKEETEEGILGRTFSMTPDQQFNYDGKAYVYRPALTTGSTTIIVKESGNVITLVYSGYDENLFYTDDIIAKENAWINDGVANMPTSNDDGLNAANSGGSDPGSANRDILLKFDMDYIHFTDIVDAKLKFYVMSTGQAATRTTSAYPVSSNWANGEVTWNNAPSYNTVNLMGTVSFSGGKTSGWFEIDITDYLASHAKNGMGDFSVRLTVDTASYYVAPFENGDATAPRLVVSYLDDGTVARQNVMLRIVDQEGNKLVPDEVYDEDVPIGRLYKYNETPETFRKFNDASYVYMEDASTTSVVVTENADDNVIILVYGREDSGIELKVEFSPYMNTYSDSSAPDSVVTDRDTQLVASSTGGSVGSKADRNIFLMFDLSDISFSEITSAKLGFNVQATGNNTGRTIYASLTDASWDANTLTWDNAPDVGESIGEVTFNHNETGWYEIDISEALAYLSSGTTDLSIALSANTASTAITPVDVGDGLGPKLYITYINDGTVTVRDPVPVYKVVEDTDGNILEPKTVLAEKVTVGSTYVYSETPESYIQLDGVNYMYSAENSNLKVRVTDPDLGIGDNTIHIVYEKLPFTGDIVSANIEATDNGYTSSGDPNAVQDSSDGIRTSSTSGSGGAGANRKAYLKFALSDVNYSKIISAKLRLYVQQAANNASRTTEFYIMDDNSWSGDTITWNNAPEFGDDDKLLGSVTFSNGTTGWQEVDITDYLSNMDYKDVISIAFLSDTGANVWGSIGSGSPAQLELVYIEGEPRNDGISVDLGYVTENESDILTINFTVNTAYVGQRFNIVANDNVENSGKTDPTVVYDSVIEVGKNVFALVPNSPNMVYTATVFDTESGDILTTTTAALYPLVVSDIAANLKEYIASDELARIDQAVKALSAGGVVYNDDGKFGDDRDAFIDVEISDEATVITLNEGLYAKGIGFKTKVKVGVEGDLKEAVSDELFYKITIANGEVTLESYDTAVTFSLESVEIEFVETEVEQPEEVAQPDLSVEYDFIEVL